MVGSVILTAGTHVGLGQTELGLVVAVGGHQGDQSGAQGHHGESRPHGGWKTERPGQQDGR